MQMKKTALVMGVVILIAAAALGLYQLPPIKSRLSWRFDFALTYLRGIMQPAGKIPTALPPPTVRTTRQPSPTSVLAAVVSPAPTQTPAATPTPLAERVSLPAPAWEKQDINNCGPAALAMYLRYYGWEGDQFEIADLLKPQRDDRNVNVEELAYFTRTRAGWLHFEYRVGGNLDLIKKFVAAGIPVMIEESFYFDSPFWPNDDLWAAHYNLITGYDDTLQTFTSQDSYHGADQSVPYQTLDEYWQVFNRVYILVYLPNQEATVKSILGEEWDASTNRQRALDRSILESENDPDNPYAWFNLGANLVYFERYGEAALAYDRSREIGLPQRMLRYQFGPFLAYFHTGRLDDLEALTSYALRRTPNSEEALLWRGWLRYRQGEINEAAADFQAALAQNPNYLDAQYALDFIWGE